MGQKERAERVEAQDRDLEDKDVALEGKLVHGPACFAAKNASNEVGQGATERYRPAGL